jgi:hypothetical protein
MHHHCFFPLIGKNSVNKIEILYALNLWDTTSKFGIVAMFIINNVSYRSCSNVYNQLHKPFYIPNSNGSLVTPIKLKANKNFRTAIMLMFYVRPI